MKVQREPCTGKLQNVVYYLSRFGQCCRALVIPRDPATEAQARARSHFAYASGGWGLQLTEAERQLWITAALSVASVPSLGQYAHLSGQQLEVKINSTLQCIGRPTTPTPPQLVTFPPSPVTRLDITNTPETGVRLLLSAGTVTEDIMVYGQPPCSPGRMKRRRVYYLGLAGAAINGQIDLTSLYTAKFGALAPGQKVFIVTCQTRNGWKAQESEFSACVPPLPNPTPQAQDASKAAQNSVPAAPKTTGTPEVAQNQSVAPTTTPAAQASQTAAVQPSSSLSNAVYKGSTPDARGMHTLQPGVHPVSIPGTSLVHSLRLALGRLGRAWPRSVGAG